MQAGARPSGALNGGKCAAVALRGFCCPPSRGGGRQLGDAGGAKKRTKEEQNPDPDRPFAQNIALLAPFHPPPPAEESLAVTLVTERRSMAAQAAGIHQTVLVHSSASASAEECQHV